MKRFIALILSTLMVLGMLAGCNSTGSGDEMANTPAPGGADTSTVEVAGTLIINAAAMVKLTYGTDNSVLVVEGLDEFGNDLVVDYADQVGNSCSEVAAKIVQDSIIKNYMMETNLIVVRQNPGLEIPDNDVFLGSIETAIQSKLDTLESPVALVMVSAEELDDNGYINQETAAILVKKFLEVEKLNSIVGDDSPVDGTYTFTVQYGENEETVVQVNAQTGGVSQGQPFGEEEFYEGVEIQEEPEPEPTEVIEEDSGENGDDGNVVEE